MGTLLLTILSILVTAPLSALERTDRVFEVFQFPADMIPRIDGQTDDWEIVPERYASGADELMDTVKGKGIHTDKQDLDVRVKVGWVEGLNRLYFLYEAHDDYWNMHYRRGDIFEVVVDGDLSGGPYINNEQIDDDLESHFAFKGVHAQNYHIFTPPGEGRDWVFVWGCQPWVGHLPYANHAYSYDFAEGESGSLVLEFWITPFDYAPYDGPARAVESRLVEDAIIGLSWSVLDYDEDDRDYEGFWNLSHQTRMDSDASKLCAFRLNPLDERFRKPLEADWSFQVLDMEQRRVAFQDLSRGEITSWLWEFDDGNTSNEQHPIHEYEQGGEYIVVLTVWGPAGEARRVKVYDVVVR